MGEKHCGKCGEMVDEAKAFCPGCGNAFVDEKKRTSISEFDQLDHTVRLGDTMYNQMLSDMGLSISTQPKQDEEKRVEAAAPALSATPVSGAEQRVEPSPTVAANGRSAIVLVAAIVILAAIAIVAAIVLYSQ